MGTGPRSGCSTTAAWAEAPRVEAQLFRMLEICFTSPYADGVVCGGSGGAGGGGGGAAAAGCCSAAGGGGGGGGRVITAASAAAGAGGDDAGDVGAGASASAGRGGGAGCGAGDGGVVRGASEYQWFSFLFLIFLPATSIVVIFTTRWSTASISRLGTSTTASSCPPQI